MQIGIYNDRIHPLNALSSLRIQNYLNIAEKLQIQLAFFGIEQVNMETHKILASVYKDGIFQEQEIPFPLLVLNEGNTASSMKSNFQKELLFRNQVHFLFPLLDNKFVITTILQKILSIRPHLISTLPIRTLQPFLSLISKKRYLVKPFNGSNGRAITVIEKLNSGKYRLIEERTEAVLTWQELTKRIQRWIKAGNFIIQPFIRSQTPSGEIFHLRHHICRGSEGKWFSIATIADVATGNRLISNHSNAVTYHADSFLYTNFQHRGIQSYQKLQSLTFEIVNALEDYYPYSLNELALDFGIDADTGLLMFYEVNTGPEVIAFAEEREALRARHLLTYALQVYRTIEKFPQERRGGVFKLKNT